MTTQFTKFIAISLLLIFSHINFTFADLPAVPVDIDKKTYCVKEPKAWEDHKQDGLFILIDRTSFLENEQREWIATQIFSEEFAKELRPYTRIQVMFIDNKSVQEQKLIFDKCRMKTGKKNTEWKEDMYMDNETDLFVHNWNKKFIKDWNAVNKKVGSRVQSDYSYVYESIIEVLRNKSFGFNSKNHQNRKIIIVSDLLQNAPKLSFYAACKAKAKTDGTINMSKCPSYKNLLNKSEVNKFYVDKLKPREQDVENLSVEILFLNYGQEANEEILPSLIALWADLFRDMGIKIPEDQREWVQMQLRFD